jgi:hypothetical protein
MGSQFVCATDTSITCSNVSRSCSRHACSIRARHFRRHDLVRLSQLLHGVAPGWSWDVDELSDLKGMATRLRQALLLRLGLNPVPPLTDVTAELQQRLPAHGQPRGLSTSHTISSRPVVLTAV